MKSIPTDLLSKFYLLPFSECKYRAGRDNQGNRISFSNKGSEGENKKISTSNMFLLSQHPLVLQLGFKPTTFRFLLLDLWLLRHDPDTPQTLLMAAIIFVLGFTNRKWKSFWGIPYCSPIHMKGHTHTHTHTLFTSHTNVHAYGNA